MINQRYPANPAEISAWANTEGVSAAEGGRKYVQFLILQAISNSRNLSNVLVFKGGNALEFVHLPNRSTVDLDFSFINIEKQASELLELSKTQLDAAVRILDDGYGTVLRLQSMKQKPPRPDAKFATFAARVGYALPDQERPRDRLLRGEPSPNIVPVEMSMNEVVCEWAPMPIGPKSNEIQVSSLNDIVAEKLRAVLQQKSRNRFRGQDILDVALAHSTQRDDLNLDSVSEFLLRKSAARDITATKAAFIDPEIQHRGASLYEELSNTTRHTFIPFDEAWEIVMDLVDKLNIPD